MKPPLILVLAMMALSACESPATYNARTYRETLQRAGIHDGTPVYQRVGDIPRTLDDLHEMQERGYSVFATGRGPAYSPSGEPAHFQTHEAVTVISIDPDRDRVLVNRPDYNTPATLTREGLELGRFVTR